MEFGAASSVVSGGCSFRGAGWPEPRRDRWPSWSVSHATSGESPRCVAWPGKSLAMTIRKTRRRGIPVLIIDIHYRTPNGQPARYRRDAQVQTMTAARAEERRLLTALAQVGEIPTGSDDTKKVETEKPSVTFKD